jgi:pyruvate/2-oxoglutarate dehydrogenase complex dihydrolipoamide dehydrogenase (E3) component
MRPDDRADRELLSHVHPADHTNPTPSGRYNLVVIGAGTAGLITAAGAAGLGAKVALVERAHMGGDCLNVGCVPSKAVLRSAHLAGEIADAGDVGLRITGPVGVDFAAVMARMREVRARIAPHDSVERYSRELGVDVYIGEGRFSGPDTVSVGGQTLRFARAVIATGARAFVPAIPGLDEAEPLTNENVFDLTERPERLLVIGGGPIGCELSQAFARLGSRVTVVEMASQFLVREDPDAAALLLASMQEDGIDVRLGSEVVRIEGGRQAIVKRDDREEAIPFDRVLVAIGRSPNVDGLGLEHVGVDFDDRRGVHVDDHLRTTHKKIFAAGDVCMAHKFTHAADFAARTVIQNALFFGRKRLSALNMPWCTYTDPEIAHVGLYERDAVDRGIAVDTYTQSFSEVDRAITEGREEGFVRVHVKKGKDEIVGATIVGPGAGDLISEISVAMAGGLGLGGLANVIHPYPTRADAIRAVAAQQVRTRLTPGVKRLFEWFLARRR